MASSFVPQVGYEAIFSNPLAFGSISSPVVWCLGLFLLSFILAMLWAPYLIGPLRRIARKRINEGERPTLYSLHNSKVGTPSMGGILFLVTSVCVTGLALWPLNRLEILMLGSMLAIGIVGVTDDYLVTWGRKYFGLTAWHKFVLQAIVATVIGLQMYQTGLRQLYVPFAGYFHLGWLIVPFLAFVLVCSMNAVNFTDGLDGLAAGVSLSAIGAFLLIALVQQQTSLAVFLCTLMGSLMAFLWFNIFPARFFMGDVGSLALGLALGIAAIQTDQVMLLPVIGLVFVLEAISVILQITWRKLFHKKLFAIAPFHHHFETKKWPETKVTQRFWLVGLISALSGLLIYFVDML